MYRFEKLRVYHNAVILVQEIYRISQVLPKTEVYVLIDQMKRSSTSIALNIAEGTGARTDVEFKSFIRHALKSYYETVAASKLAETLFNIDITKALQLCDTVGKELNALINSLDKKKSKDKKLIAND